MGGRRITLTDGMAVKRPSSPVGGFKPAKGGMAVFSRMMAEPCSRDPLLGAAKRRKQFIHSIRNVKDKLCHA